MIIGPNHSIICCFTGTGHGAAAWMMHSSDERSAAARTSSGSLSSRENIVGTICECVMRWSRDEIEELRRIELLHDHRTCHRSASCADTLACGAE